MDCRYKVVEKSTKQDDRGNMQCELWLRDEVGGFSLLRLQPKTISRFNLGDEVVLSIHLVQENAECSEFIAEVNHV